jgi:hypothetical protein
MDNIKNDIAKNEDGTLTEKQSIDLSERAVGVVIEAFRLMGTMTPKQLLEAHRAGEGDLTEKINEIYSAMLEANVPMIFSDHTGQVALGLMQRVFGELKNKNTVNQELLLAKIVGKKYDDITAMDLVTAIVGE